MYVLASVFASKLLCTNTNLRKVRHRIMIDPEEYNRNVAGSSRNFIFGTRVSESGTEAISKLSDEEIMICSCRLPGYSLELKRWGLFLVVNVTKVAYNNTAFHHLVLSEKKKELISSLLERQNHQLDDEFDDLIVGKGKGLIFLLHGPPGVGKTYTAGSYYPFDNVFYMTQLKCWMAVREHS